MIESEKKIAKQTLNIIKRKSWNAFNLEQVLKNAKVKKTYKTKFDLLRVISKYVDYNLVNNTKFLENSSSKDMLFEVLMARFDILEENRKSFLEIHKFLKKKSSTINKITTNIS